jgi:Tol biopolymer transport system component
MMSVMLRCSLLFALAVLMLGVTPPDPAATQSPSQQGQIAFERKVRSGPHELWVMNPDGSGKRFLARGSGPQWSPDGTRIAFVRHDDEAAEGLYIVNRDGSGVRRLVADFVFDPTWSPDGRAIAFGTFTGGDGLAVTDAERGGVRRLTHGDHDQDPDWSPRGSRIVFVRSAGYSRTIAAVNTDGTQEQVLTPDAVLAEDPTLVA